LIATQTMKGPPAGCPSGRPTSKSVRSCTGCRWGRSPRCRRRRAARSRRGASGSSRSTGPRSGRPGACLLRWSPPSLLSLQLKGWHEPPNVCGVGVVALLAQGDPPHPIAVECRMRCSGLWPTDRSQDSRRRQPILESDLPPGTDRRGERFAVGGPSSDGTVPYSLPNRSRARSAVWFTPRRC
jgi:hypothetical protein